MEPKTQPQPDWDNFITAYYTLGLSLLPPYTPENPLSKHSLNKITYCANQRVSEKNLHIWYRNRKDVRMMAAMGHASNTTMAISGKALGGIRPMLNGQELPKTLSTYSQEGEITHFYCFQIGDIREGIGWIMNEERELRTDLRLCGGAALCPLPPTAGYQFYSIAHIAIAPEWLRKVFKTAIFPDEI